MSYQDLNHPEITVNWSNNQTRGSIRSGESIIASNIPAMNFDGSEVSVIRLYMRKFYVMMTKVKGCRTSMEMIIYTKNESKLING